MITPEVGQVVRLSNHDERLVITALSADETEVELVSMTDHPCTLEKISVEELLPGEDLSAG